MKSALKYKSTQVITLSWSPVASGDGVTAGMKIGGNQQVSVRATSSMKRMHISLLKKRLIQGLLGSLRTALQFTSN